MTKNNPHTDGFPQGAAIAPTEGGWHEVGKLSHTMNSNLQRLGGLSETPSRKLPPPPPADVDYEMPGRIPVWANTLGLIGWIAFCIVASMLLTGLLP